MYIEIEIFICLNGDHINLRNMMKAFLFRTDSKRHTFIRNAVSYVHSK